MLAIGTGGCSLETDVNCAGCGARLIVWLSQALGCRPPVEPIKAHIPPANPTPTIKRDLTSMKYEI
jgi:hypothetical protein